MSLSFGRRHKRKSSGGLKGKRDYKKWGKRGAIGAGALLSSFALYKGGKYAKGKYSQYSARKADAPLMKAINESKNKPWKDALSQAISASGRGNSSKIYTKLNDKWVFGRRRRGSRRSRRGSRRSRRGSRRSRRGSRRSRRGSRRSRRGSRRSRRGSRRSRRGRKSRKGGRKSKRSRRGRKSVDEEEE
jgi:hypothetical protein